MCSVSGVMQPGAGSTMSCMWTLRWPPSATLSGVGGKGSSPRSEIRWLGRTASANFGSSASEQT